MTKLISVCFRCDHSWDLDFEEETCTCTYEHMDYDVFEAPDDEVTA